MKIQYSLESDVDDYVKSVLASLGLRKNVDFNEKSAMSEYLKSALHGASKTKNKTNFGQPDFTVEKYRIPVIIEDKLSNNKHIAITKQGLKMDDKSISGYAVNGAVYYAQSIIASKKYSEAVAIGISGESEEEIKVSVYYVFSSSIAPKLVSTYTNLNFLQNNKSFEAFYTEATITDVERHKILIQSRDQILKQAKKLNKLMNNHNIGIEQRVVYVSGMLLAMQDIVHENEIIKGGLTIDDLHGYQTDKSRDSVLVMNQIQEYLSMKDIPMEKKNIMIEQFKNVISLDSGRDEKLALDDSVSAILSEDSSITKQIFAFIYEYVFLAIDMTQGALDIMAEMYSTFLKYALSDGASLGKVLTPPYITNLMAHILEIDKDSRVMDLATGSAAFLVAAMDLMVSDANKCLGKDTSIAIEKIEAIKHSQLLGIEIDAKMYTLAATNMILRGDGSSNIKKADSFTTPPELFNQFNANKFLLNPPFSYKDFGLPFFEFGLDNMEKGGLGAVIIQDSAGSGKATDTTKRILSKHTMIASIKMPADLFVPNAIVQTSIYIFKAKRKHNFDLDVVKFIDFRKDGYKRTERCIKEIDHPTERYQDINLIYRLGKNATNNPQFHVDLWDLDYQYSESTISDRGDDWNADQHMQHNLNASVKDINETTRNHFAWCVADFTKSIQLAKSSSFREPYATKLIKLDKVFRMENATPSYDKGDLIPVAQGEDSFDYVTRTVENRGICDQTSFIEEDGIQPARTFSLGLMQMVFFYRQKPWYAGQFVKRIECIDNGIDDRAMIYLEAMLNKLTNKLLASLVRKVKAEFYNIEMEFPINEYGEIDYKWMSDYVAHVQKQLADSLQKLFLPTI